MAPKKSKNDKVVILSALEQDILMTLVGRAEGVYGLEILDKINNARRSIDLRELSIGSLYPTLGRMHKAGLIKEEKRESVAGEGSPRRKYYILSMDGEISLSRTQAYRDLLAKRNNKEAIPEGQNASVFVS